MITQIGLVAGTILNLLEEKQTPLSMAEVKFHVDEAMDVINMSIGWLVRENYIRVIPKENENYLSLPPIEAVSSAMPEGVGCALNV